MFVCASLVSVGGLWLPPPMAAQENMWPRVRGRWRPRAALICCDTLPKRHRSREVKYPNRDRHLTASHTHGGTRKRAHIKRRRARPFSGFRGAYKHPRSYRLRSWATADG
jgi:hypothetical protein